MSNNNFQLPTHSVSSHQRPSPSRNESDSIASPKIAETRSFHSLLAYFSHISRHFHLFPTIPGFTVQFRIYCSTLLSSRYQKKQHVAPQDSHHGLFRNAGRTSGPRLGPLCLLKGWIPTIGTWVRWSRRFQVDVSKALIFSENQLRVVPGTNPKFQNDFCG